MRSLRCSYLSIVLAQLVIVISVFALNFASCEDSESNFPMLGLSRSEKEFLESELAARDLLESVSALKRAPGWGKRSMDDDDALSEDKRAPGWGKRAPGWGKRAPGWGKRALGWGKRAPGWAKREPGWGKRAPGWGKRAPGWGKRAPGWGGKRAPGWGKRAPGWGKRSEEDEDLCAELDQELKDLLEQTAQLEQKKSDSCPSPQ